MEISESIRLTFGGENKIELETLTIALKSTLKSLEVIAENVIDEKDYCKFYVKNISQGSFIVDISAISEIAEQLIPVADTAIGAIFFSILKLRKFLNGKKPKGIVKDKSSDETTVINQNGDKCIVDNRTINIYANNQSIEKELAKQADVLARDKNRTEFSVITNTDSKDNSIMFSKEDLHKLSVPLDTSTILNEEEVNVNIETLGIHTVPFQGNAMWILKRVGAKNIDVKVLDEEFLTKVSKSEVGIMAGTRLKVELKIVIQKNGDKYLDDTVKFFILKVLDVIPPVENTHVKSVIE